MITRSEDYIEYCRELARNVRDVQDLALRGKNKRDVTQRIHEAIVREVGLSAGDDLIDVGCGDGTLLRMAQSSGTASAAEFLATEAAEFLATEEEVAVVRRLGFNVQQGFTA